VKNRLRLVLGLMFVMLALLPAQAAVTYRSPDGSHFIFYQDGSMAVRATWGNFNGAWWWQQYPNQAAATYDSGRVHLNITFQGNAAYASPNGGRAVYWTCISSRGQDEAERPDNSWFMDRPMIPGKP
jgi:hypothetical protein